MSDSLSINTFSISSFSEVDDLVEKVVKLKKKYAIVQIISFIHNTVLVQNLKKELSKKCEDIEVVLLKHEDKNSTKVNLFSLETLDEGSDLNAEILNKLYLEFSSKDKSANTYRHQLFSRYFTDHLTNLPNVYQLRKDFQDNDEYGLVLIKIDNFAIINNFYGFVIGDYVIEEIAKYLKTILAEYDVYRLSGAEFAFSLKTPKEFYVLKEFLHELYEKINSFYVSYQNTKIFIDFTMASTANPAQKNIFSKVSMALDYAKSIGVPFWIYEDRMNFENNYAKNLELSEIVRESVNDFRIIPYFQAIIDNKTSKITKYECLARLIDSKGNILAPLLFIPIAKKIKVYNQVTMQMIDKSFAVFEQNDLEFSINLSIEDVMNSNLFYFIIEKLKNSKASSRLTFEILESESIEDFNKVEKFINEVKRYGVKIAIDDFGSGYSNFSYLIKIKADYIKIDGSLITDIDTDSSACLVVQTIVDFAQKLGMKTVAEYVHSSVVMDKVKELGIDYSQGFYIDEPTLKDAIH